MATTAVGRMQALGRAELTLLVRNKTALFTALGIPVLLTFGVRTTVTGMDLAGTGLSVGTVLLPGTLGFVLLFAVYGNLIGAYTVRREELVLKRLRTGEPNDVEILAGSALPTVIIALAQCVLLIVGGAAVLDLETPKRPDLLAAGLVLGMVMMVVMAAATAIITRSGEAAQLTPMPLMAVSFLFSSVFVPLEILPDRMADVCRLLPMTPVMELLRGGWVGGVDGFEALRALVVAVAWTALAVFAVRRWFRWEPRH